MKNGLYSIHVSLLDGRVGKGSGVVVFRDGKIVGGDAYLYYTGTYTVKDNTFKGEVLIRRHTSSKDDNPLFGGPNPVGDTTAGRQQLFSQRRLGQGRHALNDDSPAFPPATPTRCACCRLWCERCHAQRKSRSH